MIHLRGQKLSHAARKAPWAGFAGTWGVPAVLSLEIWALESAVPALLTPLQAPTDGPATTVATGTPSTSLFTAQTLPGYLKVLIYAWIQSIFYQCLAWEKFIGKCVRGMAMSGSFRDHRKAGSRALGRPCPSLCSSGSPSCCLGRLWAMCLVGVPPTHAPSR